MKQDSPPSSACTGGDCGVSIEQFPRPGRCYEARAGKGGPEFINLCPHCSVLTLPPDGANLRIATFFECAPYGYARRITDGESRKKRKRERL